MRKQFFFCIEGEVDECNTQLSSFRAYRRHVTRFHQIGELTPHNLQETEVNLDIGFDGESENNSSNDVELT